MRTKRRSGRKENFDRVSVIWITAGLGCDGESVALTAATQPSIEDIVPGGLRGLPEVYFLNPFYSIENSDEYIDQLELAASGKLEPFILVVNQGVTFSLYVQ